MVRSRESASVALAAALLLSSGAARAWFCEAAEAPTGATAASAASGGPVGIFSAFKDNYVLLGVPLGGSTPATWTRLQLSIKADLLPTGARCTLFLTYTQKSLWDLYNGAGSYPFVGNDYNPGLFLAWRTGPADWSRRGFELLDVYAGYEHESNGIAGPPSRNWDRLTVIATLGYRWSSGLSAQLQPSLWLPFRYLGTGPGGYDADGGGNPDLLQYVGYGQLSAALIGESHADLPGAGGHGVRDWSLGALLRVGSRAEHLTLEVTARKGLGSVPLLRYAPFALFAQCSLWNGELLLSYAQQRSVCRIGFALDETASPSANVR